MPGLDTSIPLSGTPVSLGGMSNPMQMMGQLLQVRALQDEQQQRQLQLGTLRRAQDDDQAMRDAIAQNTLSSGFVDYDAAIKTLSAGGKGGTALKLSDAVQDIRKKSEDTLKQSLDNTKSKLEIATRIVQGIKEEGTQDAFTRGKQYLTSVIGPEAANQIGETYDPKRLDAALTWGRDAGQQITAQHNMFEEAAKLRDQDATDKKNAPIITEGWTKLASQAFSMTKSPEQWDKASQVLNQQGLPSAVRQMFADKFSPDAVGQATALGLTPKERADIQGSAAGRAETARHDLVTEGQTDTRLAAEQAGTPELSDEALDNEAQRYAMTGQMMATGMGTKAAALKTKIANRAAELYQGLDLPSAIAAFGANKTALTKMQVSRDTVNAFEETSLKNLTTFLDQAKKVVDTGSPYLNRPVRALSDQLLGSPQMSAYNAARQVVVPEIAKILGNPNLGGALTDDQRKEVAKMLPEDATLPQILSAAQILVNDMKNRKQSLDDSIKEISARIAKPPKALGDQGAGASGAGGHQVGDIVPIGGKRYRITAIHPDGTFDGAVVP